MKIDLLGQIVLIVAVLLLLFLASGWKWTNVTLFILGIWQFGSAVHLFYAYRHIRRLNYLRLSLIMLISLPVWIHLIGPLAYLPVAGLAIWYFTQTIRDTIIVYRRPRSFWELF